MHLMWAFFFFGVFVAVLVGQLVDLQSVPWRGVEVTSISAGSLAIVSAISEWRRLTLGNQVPHLKCRVSTARITLHSVATSYLSIVRFRIERRSSNLLQYQNTLPWFERLVELAMADDGAEPESIMSRSARFPENIDDKEILSLKAELCSLIDAHDEALSEYREQRAIFVMPILVTVAVSLALFKAIYQP